MTVAFELKKTLDEIGHLTMNEIGEWLAYFTVHQERLDREYAKRTKK